MKQKQEKQPGPSVLHIIVPTKDKANWVRQSQAEGKKLALWISEQLEKKNQK